MNSTRRPRKRRGEGYRLAEDIVAAARTVIQDTGDESRVTLSAGAGFLTVLDEATRSARCSRMMVVTSPTHSPAAAASSQVA